MKVKSVKFYSEHKLRLRLHIHAAGNIIIVLFLSCFCAFGQDNFSGTIKIRKPKDALPRIAGKNGGTITPAEFCVSDGIYVTQEGVKILHYEINYFTKGREYSEEVDGNAIPDKICRDIAGMKKGEQIHVYNILAEDTRGLKFQLNPMRFDLDVPVVKDSAQTSVIKNVIDIRGMYEAKGEFVNLQKTLIKLGPDSTAYFLTSPGEPVVLNQVLNSNYKNQGVYHGKFSVRDGVLTIDFAPEYSNYDYVGKYEGGSLLVKPVNQDGTEVESPALRFVVLPFSKLQN